MSASIVVDLGDMSEHRQGSALFREAGALNAAIAGMRDSMRAFGGIVQRAAAGLSRMSDYARGVVSALMHAQNLAQGLDSGLRNLYRWGQENWQSFASTLDGLAASALYLKNSFAAMAAPLINAVAPAINYVTDCLVNLFNLAGQLVARLSGSQTYVAARRTGEAWDAVGGRIGRATSALRRYVAGFDQLNVLQSGASGGGGGGGGVAGMFETRTIESGLQDFADRLREAFQAGDWAGLGQLLGEQVNVVYETGIDDATKAIEDHFLLPTPSLTRDEDVAAAAQEIMDAVDAEYNTPFATTEAWLNGERDPGNRTEETNLGDLVVDALVWSVVKEGGIEQVEPNHVVGITNGGGIRASIDVGEVSMKDINTVLPFGNTVAVIYVTGEELLEVLEASTFSTPEAIGGFPQTSGIQWTVDTAVPYDQGAIYTLNGKDTSYYGPASIRRVTIEAINGEPFNSAATYAVVTNNFIAAGGDTYNVFNRAYSEGSGFDTGIPMDQAVMDYVATELEGSITAEMYGAPHGRLTILLPEETAEEAEPAA